MQILDENNQIKDTDRLSESCHYSVLRFKDPKEPDFYFDELTYVEEFPSCTIKLLIGENEVFVPFHWSILCSDMEYIQTIPFAEFSGRNFHAFCMNPIDGFLPHYPQIRIVDIFKNTTWSCPPINDKDMLVVPIGPNPSKNVSDKGPMCAIMGPHKLDINRSLADIL